MPQLPQALLLGYGLAKSYFYRLNLFKLFSTSFIGFAFKGTPASNIAADLKCPSNRGKLKLSPYCID